MSSPGRPQRQTRFKLRGVLLDAYGTLFHEPSLRSVLFRSIVEQLNVPTEPETLLRHWRVHETAFRQSRVWRTETGEWDAPPTDQFRPYRDAWAEAFERASEELGLDAAYVPSAIKMMYDYLKTLGMYRDVQPALEALRARVPLAIVSNADEEYLHDTIAESGLRFDHVISSEGMRVYKPHPRIFLTALEALGIKDPAQALYVGDTPREDILGPHGVGMPAVWINRTEADWPQDIGTTPDYEISTLLGIVDIVSSRTFSAL